MTDACPQSLSPKRPNLNLMESSPFATRATSLRFSAARKANSETESKAWRAF